MAPEAGRLFPRFVDADDGLHPNPTSPGYWEWWYLDADFTKGYIFVTTYHFGSPHTPEPNARFIEFFIYDPQWNRHMIRKRFALDECVASEERCDVKMGGNTLKGTVPRYELHFAEGNLGADLVFESVVEPYVPHNSSRGEPPPPELAGGLGWVVAMPRAKVKGTLTVDGQKIPVEGEGYHDHNWASGAAGGPGGGVGASGWLWGRNHFGRHTLVWSAGNVGGLVIVGRDDKIIAISDRATSSTADFSSEGYPVKYPRAIELNFNEPGVITGGMKLRMLKVLDFMDLLSRLKPFQRWYTHSYVRQPAYFRYMLDGEADLEIKGEPVRYKGNIWFEHMKLK